MKKSIRLSLVAAGALLAAPTAFAQSGDWAKRMAVTPDPTKVVVPAGYKVTVFAAGLDTPSSATVDKDGNLWVAISGKLLGGPDPIDEAHVKVFDKDGKLLKEIGKGTFTTVMNEIGYCAENDTMYIPEYGEKIWEIKGVDGELTQIVKDLPDRRPPQRRHHLQGRLPLFRRSACRATPASPIRTITAGPTSPTTRSGWPTMTGSARRRTTRSAATSCIRA